jgi:hypothetical protein
MMSEEVLSPFIERVIKARPERRRNIIKRWMKESRDKNFSHFKHAPEIRVWTKEEAAEAIKKAQDETGTLTRRRLQEFHDKDPMNFPMPATLTVVFGADPKHAWTEALKMAGVKKHLVEYTSTVYDEILGSKPKYDALYFLDLYRRFGLTTFVLYKQARLRYPEVVPSVHALYREVGGMRALRYLSRLDSCEGQIMALVKLMNNLGGRWPRKELCRMNGVNRGYLEKKFRGRVELESMCRDLLEIYQRGMNKTQEPNDEK